ncbi:MAG: hypothetical protein QNJ45_22510 [Ardenticatenaceae bacterium]|nr:hypothetical protein [Ardenticatenaceae bacterium]
MSNPQDEYEELPNFDEDPDDFFLEGASPQGDPASGGRNIPWKWIIGGCLGLPLVISLLCTVIALITGGTLLSQVEQIAALAQEPTPVATLVPTADLSTLNTPTNTPPPPPPTATPFPPSGEFVVDINGSVTDLNQPIGIDLILRDGLGITSMQIIDNGQTIISERFSGQTEVNFKRNWTPLADGRHNIAVEITNVAGEKYVVAETAIVVLDPDFLNRNQAIFDRVRANVMAIRGLNIIAPIYESRMGMIDLRRFLREEGYTAEQAFDETQILALFDLAPRGGNIYEDAIQFTSTNILGFYNPDTLDLALIGNSRDLTILDEYTYAHEIMHALQDQHFSLGDLTAEEARLGAESYLPLRALAEGEAELLQEIYLSQGYISEADQVEIFNELERLPRSSGQSAAVVDTPAIIVETSIFPYQTGLEFARTIYNQSGWEGLNNTWINTPTSTEQILHPERYLNGDVPQEIVLKPVNGILDDGWRLLGSGALGEFHLRLMLDLWLDNADVNVAATGWGGDQYEAYISDTTGELVLIWRLGWDTPDDSTQFARAFEAYASRAYGDILSNPTPEATCRTTIDVICIQPVDGEWLIVRAPNETLAADLLASQAD